MVATLTFERCGDLSTFSDHADHVLYVYKYNFFLLLDFIKLLYFDSGFKFKICGAQDS